jgi:catechol 2,3-dioxygenase-like lactoylglutathione lyase family enzyme
MIGYVLLGTNDLPRAARFYDELFATIGIKRMFETDRAIAWGTSFATPALGVCRPYDGKAATHGNGTMVALAMSSKENVAAMHRKALELGGTDEGAPGPRSDNFYGAYFRDLDGNKLAVFIMG